MTLAEFVDALGISDHTLEREQGFTVTIEHDGREIPVDVTDIRFEYNNGRVVIETTARAVKADADGSFTAKCQMCGKSYAAHAEETHPFLHPSGQIIR